MLGGISFDVDWQEEKPVTNQLTPGLVQQQQQQQQPQRKTQPSTTTARDTKPVSHHVLKKEADDSLIFHYAYTCSGYCTPDGRVDLPPLQLVDMEAEGRGNGLVATQAIPRGTVIYTEQAAVATQLPSSISIRACQCCFRSLEPITKLSDKLPCADLWPVAPPLEFQEQEHNGCHPNNKRVDKHGRIQCIDCQALFCNRHCLAKFQDEYDSCCSLSRIQKALLEFMLCANNDDSMVSSDTAPITLAARMFCHIVQYYRSHDASIEGHFLSGFCGTADNLNALELGIQQSTTIEDDGNNSPCTSFTLKPVYDILVTILGINTRDEREALSLELFHALAAKAARNGFGLRTQSPFKAYYAGILRKSSGRRDSIEHQAWMKQIAQALFGKEQLERGMDRWIDEMVAPEICGAFPLTARCNHSCAPNAEVRREFADAHIDVVAVRDIVPGEEILISYIGVQPGYDKRSTIQRRRELQAKYLFFCDCTVCTE